MVYKYLAVSRPACSISHHRGRLVLHHIQCQNLVKLYLIFTFTIGDWINLEERKRLCLSISAISSIFSCVLMRVKGDGYL